jgi:hypothetical protein
MKTIFVYLKIQWEVAVGVEVDEKRSWVEYSNADTVRVISTLFKSFTFSCVPLLILYAPWDLKKPPFTEFYDSAIKIHASFFASISLERICIKNQGTGHKKFISPVSIS